MGKFHVGIWRGYRRKELSRLVEGTHVFHGGPLHRYVGTLELTDEKLKFTDKDDKGRRRFQPGS